MGVLTLIFRAYLVDQSMEHLAGALKKGGIKDLLAFFPPNKRESKVLEDYLKKEGLPQVSDWWAKKQYAVVKESLVKDLTEFCEREDAPELVCFQLSQPSLILNCHLDHRNDQVTSGRNTSSRG